MAYIVGRLRPGQDRTLNSEWARRSSSWGLRESASLPKPRLARLSPLARKGGRERGGGRGRVKGGGVIKLSEIGCAQTSKKRVIPNYYQ